MQPGALTRIKQEHLKSIQKIHAERRLSKFIRLAWRYVDPVEYEHNWHVEIISEHLEAVKNGEIRRLIINIPRRHTKSLLCNVFFPAWVWTEKPEKSFLHTTYG